MAQQQALWIRQNMLHNQNFKLDNGKKQIRRPLTEAELKVQRALEKLSIPEWYLNNSSKPPKFLKHDTPIDTRLPLWRTATGTKTKNASSSPILNERKLSGTLTENTLNNSPENTPTKNRKSKVENTPTQIINRLDTWQIRSPSKIQVNYTQSFPKISPSRKIENINIVFPKSPKLNTDKNNKTDEKNQLSLRNENSLDEMNSNKNRVERLSVRVTDVDQLLESSKTQLLNVTNELQINSSIELKKNNYNEITNINSSPLKSDNVESTSDVEYSPVSLSTIIGENLLAISSLSLQNNEALSPTSRYLPFSTNFKTLGKLMPIDEDNEINSKPRPRSIGSSCAFMESTKKSTALEQIVKRKVVGGNSLIQEMIQEFQKKCVKTDNPTFTKGSKKFVKKLVKSLENSIHEDQHEADAVMEKNKINKKSIDTKKLNEFNDINELDCKSGTSSETISLKSSDIDSGGGSAPQSPTLSTSPDYNWSTKVRADIENQFKKSSPKKCNNVQWISLPTNTNLPRTSSALSMKSRSSSRSSSNKSPCISPITDDGNHFFGNKKPYWNWSYGMNNTKIRRGSGGDKYHTVCDSGYTEQTSEHSLMIQSFLAEYEASQSFIHDVDISADRRSSFGRAP